jgi:uncharacterized protein (DUF2252 family)
MKGEAMAKKQSARRSEVSPETASLLDEGRKLREAVPREAHAGWAPRGDRRDPIEILEEQAATRIAELVPVRYGRMAVSPFAFFRGAAAIMAADLAQMPSTSLRVQSCGDAHLVNFGVFAAPDRRLVFDLNDFDETLPAPFEWDVKRLAASMAVAARGNGFAGPDQRAAARGSVRAYQEVLAEFTNLGFLDAWYARIDVDPLIEAARAKGRNVKAPAKAVAKAHRRTSLGSLARFAEKVDGHYRIKPEPPVIVPVEEGRRQVAQEIVERALSGYVTTLSVERRIVLGHYRFVDIARKVSGVGSVGTDGYMVLLMGEHDQDPLFLQCKEAQESVLAPYAGPGDHASQGERVVHGQRIMQAASDSFLGWYDPPEGPRQYYVRQLRDMKGGAEVATMTPRGLERYGRLCGACLARAHARSDQIARLSGYVGKGKTFADAITEFAVAYADQDESDYQALLDSERDGRIAVERGV